jgi:hypothetical protein
MEPSILYVAAVVLAIVAVFFARRAFYRRALERYARDKVVQMEHMAATRKFHEPQDAGLDPGVEYLNATRLGDAAHDTARDAVRYEVTMFAASGLVEEQKDVSQEELERRIESGGWVRTADRYATTEAGLALTMQFERLRRNPD